MRNWLDGESRGESPASKDPNEEFPANSPVAWIDPCDDAEAQPEIPPAEVQLAVDNTDVTGAFREGQKPNPGEWFVTYRTFPNFP